MLYHTFTFFKQILKPAWSSVLFSFRLSCVITTTIKKQEDTRGVVQLSIWFYGMLVTAQNRVFNTQTMQ